MIVSDRVYPELTGTDVYKEMRPTLNADADQQLEESFEQIRLLATCIPSRKIAGMSIVDSIENVL